MQKYPTLGVLSVLLRIVGWATVVIGGLTFVIGVVKTMDQTVGTFNTNVMAGVHSIISGLMLLLAVEAIKVIVDIEQNTRIRASSKIDADAISHQP